MLAGCSTTPAPHEAAAPAPKFATAVGPKCSDFASWYREHRISSTTTAKEGAAITAESVRREQEILRTAERTEVPGGLAKAKRDFLRAVRATITLTRVVERLNGQTVGQAQSQQLLATLQAVDRQLRRASSRLGVPDCADL